VLQKLAQKPKHNNRNAPPDLMNSCKLLILRGTNRIFDDPQGSQRGGAGSPQTSGREPASFH
jgi:hypothetical protein